MTHRTRRTNTARLGNWLPADQEALDDALDALTHQVEGTKDTMTLHPVIQEFQDLIEQDPVVRLSLTQMIAQIPAPLNRTAHLTSVDQLLHLINHLLTQAPTYNKTAMVGVPLNAILDGSMGTPAGFAAFRNDAINAMLKKILGVWCAYLSSPASLDVLNSTPTGWMCPDAQKDMAIHEYQYDPDDAHWGFASWNDFFIRRFKEGKRPIAEPENDKVIVSACESTPYHIGLHVKKQDTFWVKAQPYSLQDMLANDDAVDQFVGGTVYQAFLSAHNYHRWHSPVTGTITKAFVKDGTYYSETEGEGDDPDGPIESQGYLAHVATRALIFIECDDPVIGLLCVMPVGMGDISSCVIHPEITAGRRVTKGDELGYFQYGGSTCCLVFRPGAIADFSLEALPEPTNPQAPLVLVNSKIATAP